MKDLGPGEVFSLSLSLSLSYGTTFFFSKKIPCDVAQGDVSK